MEDELHKEFNLCILYRRFQFFVPFCIVMTHIQIVNCINLPRADLDGNSDPYVKILGRKKGSDKFKDIGKTDTIKNTLNPKFKDKPFPIEPDTEEIKLSVYDYDFMGKNDELGEVAFKIAEISGNKPITLTLSRVQLSILQNCFPAITFVVSKPEEQVMAPPPAVKPPPPQKQDIKFVIAESAKNNLILGIAIIDETEKKYYISDETTGAPANYKKCKAENEYKIRLAKLAQPLKIIPFIRTTRNFKPGQIKVQAKLKNQVIGEFKMNLQYRGEWTFESALEVPSKKVISIK